MYHIYVYVMMYVVHIMYKLYNVAHVCVMYSTRIIYYMYTCMSILVQTTSPQTIARIKRVKSRLPQK
jgi:hypothetical protein